jgi:small-conductance mechanosensitive channel
MTSRSDFTDDEWERLGRAPLVVAMAISLADPGGPLETFKESSAALRTLAEAARDGGYGEFVQSVAQDVAARAQRRQTPLGDFKPDRGNARQEVLAELRTVNALLQQKATPEELAEFREWLRTAAQRAALAATEGGFLGFGGERVSEREQQMLETIGRIFGAF